MTNLCEYVIIFRKGKTYGAKIVSIEREVRENGVEVTSFGRMGDNGVIKCDYIFYCSRERHNEIVKNFREYISGKKGV